MALTREEQETLDALTKKASEPESESSGRRETIDFYVDMSDEAAVERALRHRLLTPEEVEELSEEEEENGDGAKTVRRRRKTEAEEPPARKGYFKE